MARSLRRRMRTDLRRSRSLAGAAFSMMVMSSWKPTGCNPRASGPDFLLRIPHNRARVAADERTIGIALRHLRPDRHLPAARLQRRADHRDLTLDLLVDLLVGGQRPDDQGAVDRAGHREALAIHRI